LSLKSTQAGRGNVDASASFCNKILKLFLQGILLLLLGHGFCFRFLSLANLQLALALNGAIMVNISRKRTGILRLGPMPRRTG
jgi:hypothetical protein